MKQTKNRYYKPSHISEAKFRQFLRRFALDLNAFETLRITPICKVIYQKLKLHIVKYFTSKVAKMAKLNVRRVISVQDVFGKKGRGAAGKTPVFGILKRGGGQVYIEIVSNSSKEAYGSETFFLHLKEV